MILEIVTQMLVSEIPELETIDVEYPHLRGVQLRFYYHFTDGSELVHDISEEMVWSARNVRITNEAFIEKLVYHCTSYIRDARGTLKG